MPDSSDTAFVNHWSQLGPTLASVTRNEQRLLTPEQHLQAVANVLALASPDTDGSPASGLVEQQAVFLRSQQ